MPNYRRQLGNFGEAAATAYLIQQGFVLLERQWRGPGGEIDLVARQGSELVFVEVRTRRAGAATPEESVTPTKQARLARLAFAYLATQALPDTTPWRIDVIAIEINRAGAIARIAHIPHAVEER